MTSFRGPLPSAAYAAREREMTWMAWLLIAVLVAGGLALCLRTRQLLRLSRRQQKNIDYTKIKHWDDETEDDWR